MVKKKYFLFLMVLLGFYSVKAQSSYKLFMHEGNQYFEKGKFPEAKSKFSGAIEKSPNDFAAHYNLGNALYKEKKFAEARAEYEKALSFAKTKEEGLVAQYNLGNSLMKLDDSKGAAAAYKKALKIDPYQEEARRNYEIAMLKEKEKESKNNSGAGGGGNDGKNKSKEAQKDPNGKPSEGTGGEGGSGKGEDGENKGDAPKGSQMPKNEQNALLNRVEGRESETARKILNKNTYSVPRSNEKDW